jgi:hypothetical protein
MQKPEPEFRTSIDLLTNTPTVQIHLHQMSNLTCELLFKFHQQSVCWVINLLSLRPKLKNHSLLILRPTSRISVRILDGYLIFTQRDYF